MNSTDKINRAGRYIRQTTGYSAFLPEPLPPHPPIQLEGDIQELLSKADRALGRLDGSIQTIPNPDLFVAMYVRKEAVLSSQIEGTQSSLQDVLAAEAKVMNPDAPKDVDEVFNYIKALNYGLERLKNLPVSVRLFKEIHERLLLGTRGQHLTPGELRRSQNWIGPAGCTLSEASFVPPPPHEVQRLLGELELFLHNESPLPLLIRIGLAHAQFETIHPFLDGNGRMGRLFITFLLCEKSILQKPVLYLSYYFKKHRNEYYKLLQEVRDQGKWEEWLGFFLKGVYQVSQEATETARRILELRENHREIITAKLGRIAGNGHRVLDNLFQHPIITVNNAKELTGTSYPAANALIKRLVDLNIITELTGYQRNRRYIYKEYLGLFK